MIQRGGRWYTNFRHKGRVVQVALGTTEKRRAIIELGKILERLENDEEVVGTRKTSGELGYPGDDERGRRIWELHVQPFFGGYRVQEIDEPLIERYIQERWGDAAPQSTVKKELRVLKMVACQAKKRWELPEFSYKRTERIQKSPLTPEMVEAAARTSWSFFDGKSFADNEIIIGLGITVEGEKIVLGFIESSTENHRVCRDFLNGLTNRGLNAQNEILFVIDGAKGLYKGIKGVLSEKAVIQRCQWHKRENVVGYLDKSLQPVFRRKLQAAYEQPTYEAAKKRMGQIEKGAGSYQPVGGQQSG